MLIVVSGMAFEANIAKGQGIETVYGLDPQKLASGVAQAVARGAEGILSFGTAAGLSPLLVTGTVIVGQHVHCQERVYASEAAWVIRLSKQLPKAIVADIAGIDAPVVTVQEKSELRVSAKAAAADMESHRAASLAEQHQLPFAALRVVLDDANCSLPAAALAALRPDGSVSIAQLLRSLLLQPQQLPGLLRLSGYHNTAKAALLDCRHRLGGNLFALHRQ